jgi:hypothetical protein
MSELIQKHDGRTSIRWKLLTGASVLALIASSPSAVADGDHPLLWIELGGNVDMLSGTGDRFDAPFLHLTPTPGPYQHKSPFELQKPSRFTFGGEASVAFQPENSDWIFSAGIRYGRSNNKRDVHRQTGVTKKFPNPEYVYFKNHNPAALSHYPSIMPSGTKYAAKFAETTVNQSEHHMVLDFQAGKDVGLGMLGHNGKSVLSGGVRMARFSSHAEVSIRAKPNVDFYDVPLFGGKYEIPFTRWSTYYLHGQADRSFHGIGPSLSWSGSTPVAGNVQNGELELDWGVNGAVLFGRQKAKISHQTTAKDMKAKYHTNIPTNIYTFRGYRTTHYITRYKLHPAPQNRSRGVRVPNLGATIGVSYRIEQTKLSLGYRADYFFGAVDGGIGAAKKTTLGFNGLYASVSVGLGD